MDPLSALGLVANIIQVVDAATDAFQVCHQIYTLGASIEDFRMSFTSKQLHESYTVLVSGCYILRLCALVLDISAC